MTKKPATKKKRTTDEQIIDLSGEDLTPSRFARNAAAEAVRKQRKDGI